MIGPEMIMRPSLSRRALPLGAAALLALPLAACSSHDAPPGPATVAAARAVPVRTARVETRDLQERLELTGTLRPRAQVNVAAEVSARMVRLLEDEGARVAEGEVIATLDATDYRLAHDRAQAALAVAEANRAHALAERDRADQLVRTGGITDKDRLAAQVALQVAEASLAQVKAEVAIARQTLTRTEVRAPFSGRVARRLADVGALLAPGTPIVTLVDDEVLEFRAQVPSADYDKVRVGAAVAVTVDALPDWQATGTVARITPMVDERSRTFEVVVRVAGGDRLIAGLFARAAIAVREVADALVVPPSSLARDGARPELAHVFVVADGKADRREVTLGIEESDVVQVVRGLSADDLVVIDPPVSLSSGSPVEIQNGGK
jgi:RND family efflux transporter MFP subunit